MKILFLSDNFPPEVNAPATRTYEHCREWVKEENVDVTVITSFPNYPQGRVYDGYKNQLRMDDLIEDINVTRIWSFIAANEGTYRRILDQLSFAITSFFFGLFRKCDVIIATSPQFFVTITGYLLSIIKRKPWVFELRDLWPDTIVAVGAIKNRRVLKILEWLELFLYRKADLIIPVTDAFKQNLVERGIDTNKIHVVTNGANLVLFEAKDKNNVLLKKLSLEGKIIVGYIGTHGMTHGLDSIIRTLPKIKNQNVHFLFIGAGAEKEKLILLSKDLSASNITFLDPVSKAEISEYISIIDIGLVPLKKKDTFKTVIPSKIFELASMRKPILLGVEGQAKVIIDEFGAGIGYEPENEEDFLEKLQDICSNEQQYANLQNGCSRLAQEYDRVRLANKMLKHLRLIVK